MRKKQGAHSVRARQEHKMDIRGSHSSATSEKRKRVRYGEKKMRNYVCSAHRVALHRKPENLKP
jgi:hypothetical protein